jgi:DNA-binding response OmpR family regulator
MKTLRGKLKAIAPDEDVLITHRGVGYSIKEIL